MVSLQSDDKQLTPFTDRRSKLYIFKPSKAPESLYVEERNNTRRNSLLHPAGRVSSQANDTTMFYSPEGASTTEFMSALDELQSEPAAIGKSLVNKRHINRLASPNTSTPKTHAPGQRTRASLSNVYRLSGTCCICLEEKSDNELIPHDKCGRLFCRRCLQVRKAENTTFVLETKPLCRAYTSTVFFFLNQIKIVAFSGFAFIAFYFAGVVLLSRFRQQDVS